MTPGSVDSYKPERATFLIQISVGPLANRPVHSSFCASIRQMRLINRFTQHFH